MVMTSKINLIFQVSESRFMIENLILRKKTDINDGTGVSHHGNIYIICISSYCGFCVDWSICWPKYYKN